MFGLGPWELAIILVFIILVFGASRLPAIGRALGGVVRELRSSSSAGDRKTEESSEVESAQEKSAGQIISDIGQLSQLRTTRGKLRLLGKLTKLNKF